MRGVPVRIEVGPRDLEEGKVVIFRRDTCAKDFYKLDNLTTEVAQLLKTIQHDMLEAARVRRDERIIEADDMDGILAGVEGGNFVKAGWCGNRECEDEIKAKTAASARVFAEQDTKCKCAVCGKKAVHTVIFARAY
jgi:prolyl-tRNA synthetase